MRVSETERNAALEARGLALDGGFVRFYSGPVPATADTGLAGNTLIVQCALGTPACVSPAGGSMSFNPIGDGTVAASGEPSFARFVRFDGSTVVADMDVPGEIALSKLAWETGEAFAGPSVTWSLPSG